MLAKEKGNTFSQNLPPILHAISKLFADDRFVVRTEAASVFQTLLTKASPDEVISIMCRQDLKNKSCRTRENCLNMITGALLAFPSNTFNLDILCTYIVPSLLDSRRRVKQAAMECVSAIAQNLGSENMSVLMNRVYDLEVRLECR